MTLKIINDIPPSHGWYSACEHIFRPNVYCSACMRVHYLNNVIKRMFFLLFGNTNGAIHAIRLNLSLNKDEWSGKPSCREHFNFLHHDQLHLAIYVLQPKVQNLTPPPPPLRPLFCNNSLKLLAAWGLWIGISPYWASICSFSTVKMLFLKCTLEENSRRLKRRRIELWRLLQS